MINDVHEWITLEEAASALKVSVPAVQELVDGGALGAAIVGNQVRIPARAMRRYATRAERTGLGRRFKSGWSLMAACAAGVLLAGAGVFAAGVPGPEEVVPRQIPYRGVLEQDGAPVTNAAVPMEFKLFRTEVGGVAEWSESQTVSVMDGEFNVALGDVTAIPAHLFAQPSLYLAVTVGGDPLTGRQRLLTLPYAHRATSAASVDSVPPGAVMFFNLPNCPAGWRVLDRARGRALVGTPLNGAVNLQVGTAFANGENRLHSHTIAHSHNFNVTSAKATGRTWDTIGRSTGGYISNPGYFVVDTLDTEELGMQHEHSVSGATQGASVNSAGQASDLIPYLQLMACEKF